MNGRVALSVSALFSVVIIVSSIPSPLADGTYSPESFTSGAKTSQKIAEPLEIESRVVATVTSTNSADSTETLVNDYTEPIPVTPTPVEPGEPKASEEQPVDFTSLSLGPTEVAATVEVKPWDDPSVKKYFPIGIIYLDHCSAPPSGTPYSLDAPSKISPMGVTGTQTNDLISFATAYNSIRMQNCLPGIPFANFRYDSCMEQRLFWMAEDPSTDPLSAWGHIGSQRSDGVPSVGCDGNLAGGTANTGATVAKKWWDSTSHRASLYRPTSSIAGACIYFAMTHGGVPNEPFSFTRAAARWSTC